MTIFENIIYALGLTYTLVIIAVLCRPYGLTVLRQSTEVLMGVIMGDLEYRRSEEVNADSDEQSDEPEGDDWTLARLLHLKHGLNMLELLYSGDEESEAEEDHECDD
jgi:hypothetical protein